MKLDLPDDHPIAKAIRDATGDGWNCGRLFLRIDELTRKGDLNHILTLEIDQWSKVTRKEFECELTDPAVRNQQMAAMLEWPSIDDPSQLPT